MVQMMSHFGIFVHNELNRDQFQEMLFKQGLKLQFMQKEMCNEGRRVHTQCHNEISKH